MSNVRSGGDLPEESEDLAPRSRDRVGEVVDGKYEVVRRLGEGGLGVVYEVRHRVIGRRFAMKFLHEQVARSAAMVARFRREAEAAGRLESENVVAVVDFGSTPDGTPYLVMEYLGGENLAQLLRSAGPLPVARAVGIVLQLCRGLEAAHARGIIHRDIKPENVFVVPSADRRDLVKILDFGIAKLVVDGPGGITHSGTTLGTPHYMSPEQARGDREVDVRTDVYAIGVILYELLTGTKPHPGANATAVIFHLLKQEPPRVEAVRAGLPRALADAIHRAIAFDAADRFATVAELAGALRPFRATDDDGPVSLEPAPCGESVLPLSSTVLQVSQTVAGRSGPSASGAPPREARSLLRQNAWLVPVVLLACAVGAMVVARRTDAPTSARPEPPPSVELDPKPPTPTPTAPASGSASASALDSARPPARSGPPAPRPTATASAPRRRPREDLYEP